MSGMGKGGYEAGFSTQRIPPTWGPERQDLSFRQYKTQLKLWLLACHGTIQEHQVGPTVAQRLTGLAYKFAVELMEHDETILTHGTLATDTTTAESGVEVLMRLLEAKWSVPQETQQVEAISQYIDWHRQSGESLNDAITRFELLRGRARTQGPIEIAISRCFLVIIYKIGYYSQ